MPTDSDKNTNTDSTAGADKNTNVDKNTSVMFDHCVRVYRAMLERAQKIRVGDGTDEVDIMVYEGRTTHLFAELRLSTPYYTRVLGDLKEMRCVDQLRRGGGNTPSQWQLISEPTEAAFHSLKESRRPTSKAAMALQQARDLDGRLAVVEQALGIRGAEEEAS